MWKTSLPKDFASVAPNGLGSPSPELFKKRKQATLDSFFVKKQPDSSHIDGKVEGVSSFPPSPENIPLTNMPLQLNEEAGGSMDTESVELYLPSFMLMTETSDQIIPQSPCPPCFLSSSIEKNIIEKNQCEDNCIFTLSSCLSPQVGENQKNESESEITFTFS